MGLLYAYLLIVSIIKIQNASIILAEGLGRPIAVEVDPHVCCLYYGDGGRKKSRNGRAP
jgi:hypothetical protein